MTILDFLHTIENLKRTKRTGWLDYGVKDAESISDHMHRMSVLALLIDDPALDKNKIVKMAIVHDLAEAIVGDLTPNCGISKQEKSRMESEAMDKLAEQLDNSETVVAIKELWQEYENGLTPEAMLVKDLDKFEFIAQALEYEKRDHTKCFDNFFSSVEGKIRHPTVQKWTEDLYKERAEARKPL